ncbi:MAG TPA: SufE family protein [Hyphomicrobiaceae bacterium]|nr:SufE family protein [Hyphomicrobiaceae bacterium]
MSLDTIRTDFALLDEWEDRYRYIIELGRDLPPLDEALRTDANKVRGCASQVWIASELVASNGGSKRLVFHGDSDAHIVRGLIAILFAIVDGKSPEEILSLDINAAFTALGLREHLTPQRSNGVVAMIERIRADAAKAASAELSRLH